MNALNTAVMIAAARSCLGTRFRHQGRSRSHGLDCLGLIVVSARAAGMPMVDECGYGRQPNAADFARIVAANSLIPAQEALPGAIAVFDLGDGPQHVALLTPGAMIHAYAPARKVIEHGYREPWPSRLSHLYAFAPIIKDVTHGHASAL